MRLSPMIVQGLWNKTKKCDLLQLPHLVENQLRHFVTKKRNIQSIRQFVAMNDSDRRSILRNLTDEQYDDIMRVCSCYPHVEMDVKVKGKRIHEHKIRIKKKTWTLPYHDL
jgi:translocation protein SEC63